MHELSIHEGTYLLVAHLDADVIPAAFLYGAGCGDGGTLRCGHGGLDAVLGIAPSAEVEPLVIVLVKVVEDDEEALVASLLAGLEGEALARLQQ